MNELRVYKYALHMVGEQAVPLPHGAKVLTCRFQRGVPTLWALVDPAEKQERFHIVRMAGTGNDVDATWRDKYVSTDFLHDGALVFHFFCGVVGVRGDDGEPASEPA